MPIVFKCSSCGKQYKVKIELAGKRFKCKKCEEPVQVPRPKRHAKPKPVPAEDDDDFLNALSDASEDEYKALPVAPKPRRPQKASSPKKKKKSRQKQGDKRGWFYKFCVGVATVYMFLRLIAFVTKGIDFAHQEITGDQSAAAVPGENPNIRGDNWREFTPSEKIYTILMPGVPKPSTQMVGGIIERHHRAKNNEIAVDVTNAEFPVPGDLLGDNERAQMLNEIRQKFQQAEGVTFHKETPIRLGKYQGREFVLERGVMTITIRAYSAQSHIVLVSVVTPTSSPQPGAISKLFNSFKLNDISPAEKKPNAKQEAYLQRRKSFQTKLLVKGPAPQKYQQESPPSGVEEITYRSGELKLKAWIDRRGAKGGNAPALLYLHGGFAFGAEDLEVCKSFRDAGFIVMTPMLRGENGNPGSFELFYGEVDDAAAACRWLAEQEGVDKKRIYAFGHSIGGGLSALLSLRDDVPLAHCGSSGGVYPASMVAFLVDNAPFDRSNLEESYLRVLIGNVHDMQHNHYAYSGSGDAPMLAGMNRAKKEAGAQSRLTTEVVPGDHLSSFAPALNKYLQRILKAP